MNEVEDEVIFVFLLLQVTFVFRFVALRCVTCVASVRKFFSKLFCPPAKRKTENEKKTKENFDTNRFFILTP
jgi:hypothetical protein